MTCNAVEGGHRDQERKHVHRNVLQLGWTVAGTKAVEAVTETQGATTNFYYQVTHKGKEVLQTVKLSEAEQHYNLLK
jgi:hypothetical protein